MIKTPWTGSPEQLRRAGVEGMALHFYGALKEIEVSLVICVPWTEREKHIYAIAAAALNLADGEITQKEEFQCTP